MNRHLAGMCHVALWAFMFLSPLTFWRGTGITFVHYLMTCMQPLMLMIVFYINYLYLAPKFFVAGKHRYNFMINVVLILAMGIAMHHWMDYINRLYTPYFIHKHDTIGVILYILRDSLNLAVFAGGATTLALARRWVTADQQLKASEAARAQAELSNLRNQINPHFLLNTLNNIYALTAFDAPKAQQAIQELSKMLRHILYDYQQPTVMASKELEFLRNYVKLMKLRLPSSVDVTFDINCSDQDYEVAPMIFISLIENAFKHGVSPTEPSFVHIRIENDSHHVCCDIENSNFPKSADDRSGHGIGLQQVQRRLDLCYPNRYKWTKGCSADNKTYRSTLEISDEAFT